MERQGILGLSLGLLWLLAGAAWAEPPAGWSPARDHDGIQVYTRKVEGSPIAASLAVTRVELPLAAVAALILDVPNQHDWIDSVDESRVLQRLNAAASYNYTVSRAPWPVADRDAVVLTRASRDPATGVVRVESHAAPALIPERKGRVRVRRVDSLWTLTPLGPARTEVRYQVHSDPGGSLPAWLVNAMVTDQPFNTLRNLRRAAAVAPYASASLPPLPASSP